MTIKDRVEAILKHFEEVTVHATEEELGVIEAQVQAEIAKVESMVLGLVAQLKARVLKK